MLDNSSIRPRAIRQLLLMFAACATLITVGCQPAGPPATSVTGKVQQNGKGVFPVVLMLQDSNGRSYTANVKNENGDFSIFGIEPGSKYSVAIEPIKLPGISQADRDAVAKTAQKAAEEGRELTREETIPSQYRNANIDFPSKYHQFETSGLFVDCTQDVPKEPIVFDLK